MRKELHKKAVYKRRLKKLAKSYKYRLEMQRKFFKGFGYDIEPPARKEHLDALGLLLLSPNVRLVIKLADNEVGKGLKAMERAGTMKGGRGLRDHHIYALYRGDTYLMDGTLEEIAEKRGVKRVTLQWMLRPSYAKRYLSPPKRVPKRQCLTLTRLDDDEDADEDA